MTCDGCLEDVSERRRLLKLDGHARRGQEPRMWLLCARCSHAIIDVLDNRAGAALADIIERAKAVRT